MASPLSDCDIVADAFPMLNVRRPDCCIRERFNMVVPVRLKSLTFYQNAAASISGLYGELPDSFSNFTKLVNLDLSLNQLSGRIPKSIGTLQTLDTLFLEQNAFEGPIPSELGELVNISTLRVSNNLLTGDIPVSFANLRNISTLGFDRNRLSGKKIAGNYLIGPVPSSWRWGLEESDVTESNLRSIFQRQRLPAECLAFYETVHNSPLPPSLLQARHPYPLITQTHLPLVNTTVLAASIATSLLLVFALSAVALYAVRRRRQIDGKAFFSIFSKSSSMDSEPRFTSHPSSCSRSAKKRWWRVVLHLIYGVLRNEGNEQVGDGSAPTVGRSSTLMGKSNGSVASVGRSGTVATSIEHDSMARDPEDWSRKEVISWLAKCGFRPAVIEVFEAHEITGALLMELTEDRLIDMGIIDYNSRALIEFALQRLRYSKGNGRFANMTSEFPVAVNQEVLPEYS
ncbi:hypothetical protein BC829DRAFT_402919 [Chytridium lagenaria]|nr:hypothetical protein BC829DRAFT_402919 [Chytridium lagenaria]